MNDVYEVPSGWAISPIEDVIAQQSDGKTVHQGWSPQCERVRCETPQEWGVLKTTAIQAGEFQPEHHKRLPQHLEARPSIEVSEGDLLLTCAGPRIRCGVACLVRSTRARLMLSGKMYRFRAIQNVTDPRYLELFLQTDAAQAAIDRMKTGGSESGLNLTHDRFKQLEVLVAPYNEQTRIVEKLEELLSDLDAGVAELKAAQRKLAQYRQSLLKAAVEGELTADWRAARAQTGEPQETGAELLQRILTERRARWETSQLARFAEQGKTPPKGWQDKYKEPVEPDITGLAELPNGWVWASLGQIIESLTSGSRDWAPYYDRGKCTFVMAQNVRPWRPDFTFQQFVDPPVGNRDRARSAVEKDDLLVTIVGANTGQVCRVTEQLHDHFVCQSVGLIRLVDKESSEFINAVLNSPGHGQRQFREMNYGAGRPHLSFDQLESVLVPLPSPSEQMEILERLEVGLAATKSTEAQMLETGRFSSAQRKNILKSAFSGQLVPQNPNDEPAGVLLERIRAMRTAKASKTPVPHSRKRKAE